MEKTIEELEKIGFEGNDASLETSLFEYGLIGKFDNDCYTIYYGIKTDTEGTFTSFDWTVINQADIKNMDWIDWTDILSFTGIDSEKDFFTQSLLCQLSSLISYYGTENIFGTSYTEGFTITNDND